VSSRELTGKPVPPSVRRGSHRFWLRLFSITCFLVVWQVGSIFSDPDTLPAPFLVLQNLWQHLTEGELPESLAVTMRRVVLAFLLAMATGTLVGFWMGRSRSADTGLDSILILALNVPALVTIILCYLWIGLNEVAAVVAVAINKMPTVVVTVREGAKAIDRELLDVARAYRLSRWRTLRYVYLPQLLPYLMAAARSGLSLIWKIVLVVELLGRSDGVGFQLGVFFQFFDITSILAYTISFASIIMAIEFLLVQPLERKANRWRTDDAD
jgi:NitT/TauT family transport system permease protein